MTKHKKLKNAIGIIGAFLLIFTYAALLSASLPSRHFVIVIPSYNNKEWYKNNIESAIKQKYDNFEIIYIDDCSPDGTGNLVEAFLAQQQPSCKVTLIKNTQRCGALNNIYRAIMQCDDDDIIVTLDGDDCLAHDGVLTKLNTVYANPNVWMTHGQLKMFPSGTICSWSQAMPQEVIANHAYRNYRNIPTHLRTFYAWLFRKIKLEDLLYEGKFFPMTWDMAFMIPMMELSGGNHAFIDEVLYIYNEGNPINDHKVSKELQKKLDLFIRGKKRYTPISRYSQDSVRTPTLVDCIVCASNTAHLNSFLEAMQTYIIGIENVHVLWSDDTIDDQVQKYVSDLPFSVTYYYVTSDTFKNKLVNIINSSSNHYLLFATDHTLLTHDIDLQECTRILEQAQAYGFYLATPPVQEIRTSPYVAIDDHVCVWQFGYTPATWINPGTPSLALYRTNTLQPLLSLLDYDSFATLELCWSAVCNVNNVGVFYNDARAYTEKLIPTIPLTRQERIIPVHMYEQSSQEPAQHTPNKSCNHTNKKKKKKNKK